MSLETHRTHLNTLVGMRTQASQTVATRKTNMEMASGAEERLIAIQSWVDAWERLNALDESIRNESAVVQRMEAVSEGNAEHWTKVAEHPGQSLVAGLGDPDLTPLVCGVSDDPYYVQTICTYR